MGKGRQRWGSREIRHRSPLPGERQSRPRCDRSYEASAHGVRAEFSADGTVTFDGQAGTWHAEKGILRVTTPHWHCEGPIGVEDLYLVCSRPEGGHRVELQMLVSPAESGTNGGRRLV